MNIKTLALVATLSLLLFACVVPGPQPQIDRSIKPTEIDALLTAPLKQITALTATGTLRFDKQDVTLVAETSIHVVGEQGLRIDLVTPFFTPIMTLAARPDKVVMLDYQRRLALFDRMALMQSGPFDMADFTPMQLAQVLRGGLELPKTKWQAVAPEGESEEGLWMYADGSRRAGIDPQTLRPAYLLLARDNPIAFYWTRFKPVDGTIVAQEISVQWPARKAALRLKMSDVKINESPAPELFAPEVPAGWHVVQSPFDE